MAVVLGAVMTVGLMPGGSALAQPLVGAGRAQASTSTDAEDGSAARSEEEALKEAERTGELVEVTSLRGASSDVYATPEGNFEAREYLRPVRTRVNGRWTPVDTDLAASGDGVVAPEAATVDLEFSGGGDAPMVRMERAGRVLELRWPGGDLPQPQLEGSTAVYPEVLPGVDLRLAAQPEGFSQLLVVKSAEAAASEELTELQLGLNSAGMTIRETTDGGLEAVDNGTKTPVFEASKPLMWDSSGTGTEEGALSSTGTARTAAAAMAGEGGDEPSATESKNLAPVEVEVPESGDHLLLTPDVEVLRGEDTEYPVFIDPQWYSPRASAWTMASRYWASSPQWKFNGESNAGMGYCGWARCAPQDLKRLFYRIPTSRFAGKEIISAEFTVRNVHSASCTDREVQLWRTKGINSSTTWNTQSASGFWIDRLATKSFAYGYEGCAAKDAEFNVKGVVQKAANKGWSSITFGMRATSESDPLTWKRFSDKAHLRVRYNRPPPQVKMSQLVMEYGGTCKRPDDPARVRTLGKLYINDVTDPDGDPVSIQVRANWDSGDGQGVIPRWKPPRTTSKRSGSNFALSLPQPGSSAEIPENTKVHWYVRSYDGRQYSPWSWSGSPTGCYFIWDTDTPAAPTISSGEYPESNPEDPNDPWYDGVGKYGYFTLDSPAGDVTRYRFGINNDPSAKNQLSTSGGAAKTAKVLPGKAGLSFVTAQAFDEAGNGSEVRTYQFRVAAGQPERATWQFDEETGATEAAGSTPARTATLHGGVTPGAAGAIGSAVSFNGVDGYASTDIPVVNTARGFTVSAWVKLSELPDHAAIIAAQPGNHSPGFELYYSAHYDRWVFNQYSSDTPDATPVRAMADQPGGAQAGTWTHLVGSFDAVEKQLRLFVNGDLVGQTPLPDPWESRRGFQIGAGSYEGRPGSFFPGVIDELTILDKRVSQSGVDTLYAKGRIGDPGRPAIAIFGMDETPEAEELTAHGDVLPATFHGGATPGTQGVAGNALTLNGTDGYATVASPHVGTYRSFSVSAWAKLSALPDHAAIIAAQAGVDSPGFELYYSAYYDRWVFNQYASDTPDATPVRAMADQPGGVHPDSWVHLVGVHDTIADTLTLYINGTEVGSTQLGGAFSAPGALHIGAGQYSGTVKSYFPGTIDDLRLFDRPVSAEEVQQLYQQRPVLKGRWQFDSASDPSTGTGTSPDASVWGNDATLHAEAHLDTSAAFMGEAGLLLDGVDDYAVTADIPIDTSKSFTATAWVRSAAAPQQTRVAFSAAGQQQSAFAVGFLPDPDGSSAGRWQFAMTGQDTGGATYTRANNALGFYDPREWNHLALVYDGFAKQARLYVNGTLAEVACTDADGDGQADDPTCREAIPWADNVLTFPADGTLQIGRGLGDGTWVQHWPGAVDDVWTFQGALTDEQVSYMARMWFDLPTEVPAGP